MTLLQKIKSFIFAYLVFTLAMSIMITLAAAVFSYESRHFAQGIAITFLFNLLLIPLHVAAPFACAWITMNFTRRQGLLVYAIVGGVCGLFAFCTMPMADEPIWFFGWKHFGKTRQTDWIEFGGLVASGALAGVATAVARIIRAGSALMGNLRC